MLSPQKKTRSTRRHVCTCQAFECFAARFVDPDGIDRPGVELSREAFEAHQRAELRQHVQVASRAGRDPLPSPLPLGPRSQTGETSQDDLASHFERVGLDPTNSSVSFGHAPSAPFNDRFSATTTTRCPDLPPGDSSLAEGIGRSVPSPLADVSIDHQNNDEHINIPESPHGTGSAQESGIESYSCGMSILDYDRCKDLNIQCTY